MARRSGMSRVVVGFDGSPHARRAVAWLAGVRLTSPGTCTVVTVTESVRVPAMGMLPRSVRSRLSAEALAMRTQIHAKARRNAEAAVRILTKAGWRARIDVQDGVPAPELLKVVRIVKADCVVIGARGVSAARRLLLGSVAAEILKECAVPVIVVK